MKAAVVGGGVIGCAIAYFLRKEGADVVLIERGEIGGEASGAAAGMLIAPIEDTGNAAFNALRNASLALYPAVIGELQDASGIDVEYKRPGMLRTASSEEYARRLREAVAVQPGLEWVEGDGLRALEPGLAPDVLGAAYSEADADLNPGLLTNAFAKAAERLGAEVVCGSAVTGFSCDGRRVIEVSTANGDHRADAVVIAAGPWTELLTMHCDHAVRTPPKRGQMIAYRSNALRHAVWAEDGYLVPKPRGFLFAGATVEDAGFHKETTEDGLRGLRAMASRLVPVLAGMEEASAWAGLRPGSADGLPVIGPLPDRDNVYVASGHFRNGILLAPVTGKLVAEMVLRGKIDPLLVPFSPARFPSAVGQGGGHGQSSP